MYIFATNNLLVSLLFLGFSIKAVPFQNAILNVKELGGTAFIHLIRKNYSVQISSYYV